MRGGGMRMRSAGRKEATPFLPHTLLRAPSCFRGLLVKQVPRPTHSRLAIFPAD